VGPQIHAQKGNKKMNMSGDSWNHYLIKCFENKKDLEKKKNIPRGTRRDTQERDKKGLEK